MVEFHQQGRKRSWKFRLLYTLAQISCVGIVAHPLILLPWEFIADQKHTDLPDFLESDVHVYVFWIWYLVFVGIISVWAYLRRDLQPLKSRSLTMLLVSTVSGVILRSYLTLLGAGLGHTLTSCSVYRWIVNICFPGVALPYVIRAFRLHLIFRATSKLRVEYVPDGQTAVIPETVTAAGEGEGGGRQDGYDERKELLYQQQQEEEDENEDEDEMEGQSSDAEFLKGMTQQNKQRRRKKDGRRKKRRKKNGRPGSPSAVSGFLQHSFQSPQEQESLIAGYQSFSETILPSPPPHPPLPPVVPTPINHIPPEEESGALHLLHADRLWLEGSVSPDSDLSLLPETRQPQPFHPSPEDSQDGRNTRQSTRAMDGTEDGMEEEDFFSRQHSFPSQPEIVRGRDGDGLDELEGEALFLDGGVSYPIDAEFTHPHSVSELPLEDFFQEERMIPGGGGRVDLLEESGLEEAGQEQRSMERRRSGRKKRPVYGGERADAGAGGNVDGRDEDEDEEDDGFSSDSDSEMGNSDFHSDDDHPHEEEEEGKDSRKRRNRRRRRRREEGDDRRRRKDGRWREDRSSEDGRRLSYSRSVSTPTGAGGGSGRLMKPQLRFDSRTIRSYPDRLLLLWLGLGLLPFLLSSALQQVYSAEYTPTVYACVELEREAGWKTSRIAAALFYFLDAFLLLIAVGFIWRAWDEFKIRGELLTVFLVDVGIGVLHVTQLTEEQTGSRGVTHHLIAARISIFFIVSVVWPFLETWNDENALSEFDVNVIDMESLESLEGVLGAVQAFDAFSEWMKEKGGWNLLNFYVMAEVFRDTEDPLERERLAFKIYQKFLLPPSGEDDEMDTLMEDSDAFHHLDSLESGDLGHPEEPQPNPHLRVYNLIPTFVRDRIVKALRLGNPGRPASPVHLENPPGASLSENLFRQAQGFVLNAMKQHWFPLFRFSPQYRELQSKVHRSHQIKRALLQSEMVTY